MDVIVAKVRRKEEVFESRELLNPRYGFTRD